MGKLRWQIVGLTMVSFALMAINSSNAFAGGISHDILQKLDTIQQTLDDQVIPKLDQCCGGVPVTGQTTSYTTGDDGDLQMGIPWPDPRFTDNEDGTMTDNLTHLMWIKDAQQIPGTTDWYDAIDSCNKLEFGGYDDWRLPNLRELQSLMDYSEFQPALSPECLLYNIQSLYYYWSSTTHVAAPATAFCVRMDYGYVGHSDKFTLYSVLPVRGSK